MPSARRVPATERRVFFVLMVPMIIGFAASGLGALYFATVSNVPWVMLMLGLMIASLVVFGLGLYFLTDDLDDTRSTGPSGSSMAAS